MRIYAHYFFRKNLKIIGANKLMLSKTLKKPLDKGLRKKYGKNTD